MGIDEIRRRMDLEKAKKNAVLEKKRQKHRRFMSLLHQEYNRYPTVRRWDAAIDSFLQRLFKELFSKIPRNAVYSKRMSYTEFQATSTMNCKGLPATGFEWEVPIDNIRSPLTISFAIARCVDDLGYKVEDEDQCHGQLWPSGNVLRWRDEEFETISQFEDEAFFESSFNYLYEHSV